MSATPFEQLANLDRMVHDPARLAILTALSACERADFLFLQRITGLTKGNLSSHLSKLEEAGLVEIGRQLLEGDGGAARERRPVAAAERRAGADLAARRPPEPSPLAPLPTRERGKTNLSLFSRVGRRGPG
jgi:DNA-binding transcriptional ArsR family regulator